MADNGGLYSTTKLRLMEAKGGYVGMRARCFSCCKGGKSGYPGRYYLYYGSTGLYYKHYMGTMHIDEE